MDIKKDLVWMTLERLFPESLLQGFLLWFKAAHLLHPQDQAKFIELCRQEHLVLNIRFNFFKFKKNYKSTSSEKELPAFLRSDFATSLLMFVTDYSLIVSQTCVAFSSNPCLPCYYGLPSLS